MTILISQFHFAMGHGSLSSDPWPIWPIQFRWPIRPIDPWPIDPLSALIWCWYYYWLWKRVPRLDDSVCEEIFVKVGFGDGCSYVEWVASRRWIRCKRKEIRKVNCSEPMDTARVTEDKATMFKWLELTVVKSLWISHIFETRESATGL